MRRKLLVTGSSGFIGAAYCKKAVEMGYEVIEYDLPDFDICDGYEISEAIRKSDIVVHFAAIADLNESIKKQEATFYINVAATYDIGRYCVKHGKKLIFISTCCVYGDSSDNIETEDNTVPLTYEPYATSKMAAEWMLKGIPGLDFCILRIGTTYGPGMREALFTYIVLKKIIECETIEIHGDGEQTRQYIYIDDLIKGIMAAILRISYIDYHRDHLSGETINVCGKEKISVGDVIDFAAIVTGKTPKTRHIEDRFGQIHHENISIDKAFHLLNWWPTTSFADGLDKTFKNDKRFDKIWHRI